MHRKTWSDQVNRAMKMPVWAEYQEQATWDWQSDRLLIFEYFDSRTTIDIWQPHRVMNFSHEFHACFGCRPKISNGENLLTWYPFNRCKASWPKSAHHSKSPLVIEFILRFRPKQFNPNFLSLQRSFVMKLCNDSPLETWSIFMWAMKATSPLYWSWKHHFQFAACPLIHETPAYHSNACHRAMLLCALLSKSQPHLEQFLAAILAAKIAQIFDSI